MVYGLKKIMNHYLKKLNYFKLYEGVTNMDRLDYSSKRMEEFAIRVISKSYDCKYSKYIWHDKDDDFDFTSPDDKVALEVATILPQNIRNAIEYEKAIDNPIGNTDGELFYPCRRGMDYRLYSRSRRS